MRLAELTISVIYNEIKTDAESVASALDILMETALSTPGILDEYGNPYVGEFYVQHDYAADVSEGEGDADAACRLADIRNRAIHEATAEAQKQRLQGEEENA